MFLSASPRLSVVHLSALRLSLHCGQTAAGLPLRHCKCAGNTQLHGVHYHTCGLWIITGSRIGAAIPPGSRGFCHLQNLQSGCAAHRTAPGFFPQKVKRPGREADNSTFSSVEVKNEWSYTSTPLYALMEWQITIVPLCNIIKLHLCIGR